MRNKNLGKILLSIGILGILLVVTSSYYLQKSVDEKVEEISKKIELSNQILDFLEDTEATLESFSATISELETISENLKVMKNILTLFSIFSEEAEDFIKTIDLIDEKIKFILQSSKILELEREIKEAKELLLTLSNFEEDLEKISKRIKLYILIATLYCVFLNSVIIYVGVRFLKLKK